MNIFLVSMSNDSKKRDNAENIPRIGERTFVKNNGRTYLAYLDESGTWRDSNTGDELKGEILPLDKA